MGQFDRRWLSPRQAAEYLDVRLDRLQRLVKDKKIPAPDYSLGYRSPRFDRLALDAVFSSVTEGRNPDIAMERLNEKIKGYK
jgi:excisionase family DNA binding protein